MEYFSNWQLAKKSVALCLGCKVILASAASSNVRVTRAKTFVPIREVSASEMQHAEKETLEICAARGLCGRACPFEVSAR